MITLNTENLGKVESMHGLSQGELEGNASLIDKYLKNIAGKNQGFYTSIDDDALLDKIDSFAANIAGKYTDIVVLGIGGSALGTICINQSLTHLYQNMLPKADQPRLHVIDNIDPILIKETRDVLDLEKTFFIVATKSGATPETLAQYFYFRNEYLILNIPYNEHFVFITDPKKGFLRTTSLNESILTFEIPENVGGRFSSLTAVGLLPAKLIGLDIRAMIKGAQEMRDNFLKNSLDKNLPFQIANIQYLLSKKGKCLNIMTPYAQKLTRFAEWYRQLLAESIGKKFNNDMELIHCGLTPITALGVTDQHSQSQLYNEGPNDKLHIFIKVKNLGPEIPVVNPQPDAEIISYLNNISFNKLIDTEMQGTVEALTQNDRPNFTVEIDQIDAETLGGLFMLFEGSTAFLGEFMNINAFDQPGVELSKLITKKLLSSHAN